ncbi:MAG: pyridoxal-dependent decarboxylase, exosortase A system-associated [Halioglobus sp.]
MTNSTSEPIPTHAPMTQFPIRDNCLVVAGQPLTEIARRVGSTPFYAYDSTVINARVAALRHAMPDNFHLHYAVKANPMPAVVEHLAAITDGLDVASAGELRLALATGTTAANISFAGPGKSNEDLALAVESGVIINIESATELERVVTLARSSDKRPPVAIRVNPDFELKSAGMKMGSGPKPFGVDAEKVPALLHRLRELPVEFVGLHIFSGSQNLNAAAVAEAQSRTLDLAIALAAEAPGPLRWLNIGGGLGVPYFPGEQAIDLGVIASALAQLGEKAEQHLPGTDIVLELGRFLTAEAGIYVCEVVDRKESRGEVFLITNGGLHHHLAASGNFGQVIRKNYPLAVGNRMQDNTLEEVNVVGPLCTPLDILGSRVRLPHAGPGDLVVVFQSGAYGYSASPRDFLGHPPPGEILL